MKTVTVACIGGWHSLAKKFAKIVSEYPECRLAAVWDDDPKRGQAWAQELGCRFELDYGALVKDASIDGFVITSATARHADLIIRAADAGKHIFVEKSLATTNEGAHAIRDAVKRNGVHFLMSDPVIHAPVLYAKHLVDKGVIGDLINMHVRLINHRALDGTLWPIYPHYDLENAGGGVMLDLGGHVVHVLNFFLGKPIRVSAVCRPYTERGVGNGVEENVVAVYEFDNGSIGVGETSWISPDNQCTIDLYGTQGSVYANYKEVRYRLIDGEWISVPSQDLPPEPAYPLRYWVESILNDIPNERIGTEEISYRCVGIDNAVLLTEMITAAYRSNGKGTLV
jgi:1,5-anhydro-D-fructose reductase (1,5-anhydro-D-mannitol-forming)